MRTTFEMGLVEEEIPEAFLQHPEVKPSNKSNGEEDITDEEVSRTELESGIINDTESSSNTAASVFTYDQTSHIMRIIRQDVSVVYPAIMKNHSKWKWTLGPRMRQNAPPL